MTLYRSLFYAIIFLLLFSCIGCISEDPVPQTTTVQPDVVEQWQSTTLKKTAVLSLENGYSLKVLEIDRREGYAKISLRKDNEEYDVIYLQPDMLYDIMGPDDKEVVYSLILDRIYDSSFVIELSYSPGPGLYTEVSVEKSSEVVRIEGDTIIRTFEWEYEDSVFYLECEFEGEAFDLYSQRSRERDWTHFVNDPYDDAMISRITSALEDAASDGGYPQEEIPYIAMMFVQSLPYITDSVSEGYDEYPRYPFETLYHGGGDCEDSSILLAALLTDMGYGAALLELPGHMAVGVKGSEDLPGSYYEYSGTRYYYLETTDSGWDVGEIPSEFEDERARITPIPYGYPQIGLDFEGTSTGGLVYTTVDLTIEVMNVGSAVARDVVVYTTLEAVEEGMVWDQLESDELPDIPVDEGLTYTVSGLKVPGGERYRIGIWAAGEGMDVEYVYSEWMVG